MAIDDASTALAPAASISNPPYRPARSGFRAALEDGHSEPMGYDLEWLVEELSHECVVIALSLVPRRPRDLVQELGPR